MRALLSLLTATALLFGCAAEDDDHLAALEARVEAGDAFQDEVLQRLDELESALEALAVEAPDEGLGPALQQLEEQLAALDADLAGLDDRVADEARLRTEGLEDAETTASDLRRSLSALQGTLEEVQGHVDELRGLYETLRDRLDEHQRRGH